LRCCPVEREKPVDDTPSLLLLGRRPSPVASSFMRFYCCVVCEAHNYLLLVARASSVESPSSCVCGYHTPSVALLRIPSAIHANYVLSTHTKHPKGGARFLTNLQSKALLGLVKFIFIFSFVKFDSSTYKILYSSFLFVVFISILPSPLTPHLA
jgi:hypothetical protein